MAAVFIGELGSAWRSFISGSGSADTVQEMRLLFGELQPRLRMPLSSCTRQGGAVAAAAAGGDATDALVHRISQELEIEQEDARCFVDVALIGTAGCEWRVCGFA